MKFRNVSNWEIYALQTEEERGESPRALPLEIDNCRNLTVANFFIYRVDLPVPFETGIRVTNSRDLRFRGLHVYSPGKLSFDNTLVDATHGVEVRAREIATLTLSGRQPPTPRVNRGDVERLASGFTNIDGLVTDADGSVYFVDQAPSRIYRWDTDAGLTLVTDSIPQPVTLAIDQAGSLLVVSRHGNVYALKPGASEATIAVLAPEPSSARPGATVWLPTNRWRDSHDWIAANTRIEPLQYVSPDGSVVIPAPKSFRGLTASGRRWNPGTIDLARTYALAPARAGAPFYVADEFGQTTWRFAVDADGTLTAPTRFAEEGEAGVVRDQDGKVYVCAGQIFVYAPDGTALGVIEVPERPSAVAFGGGEGRALFIAARMSLYVARRLPHPGAPAP